jgi:O-antigen/teichoic acid export membrane protein
MKQSTAPMPAGIDEGGPSEEARHGRTGGPSLSMLTSSLALIGSKVATMGLGFLFWLVAARFFPPASVGLAAGAISAVMLCTQLALLGLGSSVIVHYPAHKRRPFLLLDTAFTIVSASSLLAAGVFFIVAATALHELRVVVTEPLFALSFAAMSVLGTATILLDQVSTAIRRGDQALVRAAGFGLTTVALLLAIAGFTHTTEPAVIFSTWVGGGVFACSLGAIQLRRAFAPYRYRPRCDRAVGRGLLRVGIPNHVLTLTERAPGLVLPIIVTELLSPSTNAAWYTAWMMAWVVYIVPIQVGMTSFAEASHRPDELRELVRHGVRTSLVIGLGAAALVALVARPLLSILGHHYAEAGATPLRILLIAVVPLTIIQAYFVVCRSTGRLGEAIVTGLVNATCGIGGAAMGAVVFGLRGMAAVWLGAQLVTACWAGWRLRRLIGQGTARAEVRPERAGNQGASIAAPLLPERAAE